MDAVRRFRRMGLIALVRMVVALLVCIMFVAFGLWLYYVGKRLILVEAKERYLQWGTLTAIVIFRNYKITDTGGLQTFIDSLQEVAPEVVHLAVLDRERKVVARVGEGTMATEAADWQDAHVAAALTGAPSILLLERQRTLLGVFPLSEGGMKPRGAFLFQANLPWLAQLRATYTLHTNGAAAIVLLLFFFTSGPLIRRMLQKAINERVAEIVKVLEKIANGDLTQALPEEGQDEIGRIAQSVNSTAAAFRSAVWMLRETSGEVNAISAGVLSKLENQVTSSTVQQSTTAIEITTSMEEMTRIAQRNTVSAGRVSASTESALATCRLGTDAIKELEDKIVEISGQNQVSLEKLTGVRKHFSKVEEVANFITDMAYQTRLIAFNATLKAAEGGGTGRAFGVIAREIRGLAENVAVYAREIHAHISEIQEATNELAVAAESTTRRIEEGALTNRQTQESFVKIVGETRNIAEGVNHISEASLQQQQALEQMLTGFRDMQHISKEVAEACQEVWDSVGHLRREAGKAAERVALFKIE